MPSFCCCAGTVKTALLYFILKFCFNISLFKFYYDWIWLLLDTYLEETEIFMNKTESPNVKSLSAKIKKPLWFYLIFSLRQILADRKPPKIARENSKNKPLLFL